MRFRFIINIIFLLLAFVPVLSVSASAKVENCSPAEANAARAKKGKPTATFNGFDYYIGARELHSQMDAFVAVYYQGSFEACWLYDEYDDDRSEANTEAVGLVEWGGRMFLTLTIDGPDRTINQYTFNGWLPQYGSGSGPQAAVIIEIEPNNGYVLRATYLYTKLEDGRTNSIVVRSVEQWDGLNLFVSGTAASYLLDPWGNPYTDCPSGSGFRYTFSYDLDLVFDVECNGVLMGQSVPGTNEIRVKNPKAFNAGGDLFLYCTNNRGIQVLGYNPESGQGIELFTVDSTSIGNALLQATSNNIHIKIGENGRASLWALKSNELQIHTNDGYDFLFPRNQCGEPTPNGGGINVIRGSTASTSTSASANITNNPAAGDLNDDGTYTVRTGDTLYVIAVKYRVSIEELAKINNIADARLIRVGQVLKLK